MRSVLEWKEIPMLTKSTTVAKTFTAYPLDINEDEPFHPEPYLDSDVTDAYLNAPVIGPPLSGSENAGG